MLMTALYNIKVFGMGGTIDKTVYSYDAGNYVVDAPYAQRIIEGANVTVEIDIESLVRKDSLELTDQDRELLRAKVSQEPCNQIIVTHGTDTIPESAKALSGIVGKTIVFTGAMLPGRFVDSDATFNLGGAVIAAQTLSPGLYLVMHGRVIDVLKAIKDRSQSLFLEESE
jgi:L-asparaginase